MGFLLLIPFFLIRFGLLSAFNKDVVKRAAHFAPLEGGERAAYWLYQVSNAAVIIVLLFQVSGHWIIRAEERWRVRRFGKAYLRYQEKGQRYL